MVSEPRVAGLRVVSPSRSGMRDGDQQGSGLCEHLLRGRKLSEGKLAFEKRNQSWTLASKPAARPGEVASRTPAPGGAPPAWTTERGAENPEAFLCLPDPSSFFSLGFHLACSGTHCTPVSL